jgi:hypothetical protein
MTSVLTDNGASNSVLTEKASLGVVLWLVDETSSVRGTSQIVLQRFLLAEKIPIGSPEKVGWKVSPVPRFFLLVLPWLDMVRPAGLQFFMCA